MDSADGIILAGVGAFKDCFEGLKHGGFVEPIMAAVATGIPLLGICVGMQMLFESSEEGEGSPGLALLPGKVVRFPDTRKSGLKVPHMGWNRLDICPENPCPLLAGLSPEPYVYFVHSFYPDIENRDIICATTDYGVEFPSVVGKDNVFGTQFHPEKSQTEGIHILKAFGDYVIRNSSTATV